jgi:hypothetical protein
MTLKDKIRFTPSKVSFSFVLRNPTQQAAVTSKASAQLTVSNVGGSDFKVQPMFGTVLRALNTARFTSYKIEEQTRVINQKNMIKLSLTSNIGISKGGILTISGLLGRDEAEIEAKRGANQCSTGTSVNITFSLDPVRIFINNDPDPTLSTVNDVIVNFKSCTDYSQVDSIIMVSIPAFFKPGADIIVEFSVINSKQKRAGCRPSVSYSGCRTQLAVNGSLSCTGQDTENACSGCDALDMITVAKTSSSNLVLISGDAARVVNAIVAESNSVLSQLNTISVTLAMNVELAQQDSITITGFQDSQPDDEGKVLTGANAEAFGYRAGWVLTLEKGELILTVERTIQINENLTFAFNITNAENEVSGKCKYGRNFCSGPGALNEGRACPKIGLIHAYTHTHTHTHTRTHIHIYTHIYTYMYIHIYLYIEDIDIGI